MDAASSLRDENVQLKKALAVAISEAVTRARQLKELQEQQALLQAKVEQLTAVTDAAVLAASTPSAPLESHSPVSRGYANKPRLLRTKPVARSESKDRTAVKRQPQAAAASADHNSTKPSASQSAEIAQVGQATPRAVPTDEAPSSAPAAASQPSTGKLRVRVVSGDVWACLQPEDPVALSILRASIPPAQAAEGSVPTTLPACVTVAADGVLLCPLVLYMTVAKGSPASVEVALYCAVPQAQLGHVQVLPEGDDALQTLRPAAHATRRPMERTASVGGSPVLSSFRPATAPSSPPLVPAVGTFARQPSPAATSLHGSGSGRTTPAQMTAPQRSLSSNGSTAPNVKAKVSSGPSGKRSRPGAPAAPAPPQLHGSLFQDNPLISRRAGQGQAAAALPPRAPEPAAAAAAQRQRRKAAIPRQSKAMDAGAPSAHGVGEKLRRSLGSSYRSLGAKELSLEAKVERKRREKGHELASVDSGSDNDDEDAVSAKDGDSGDNDQAQHDGSDSDEDGSLGNRGGQMATSSQAAGVSPHIGPPGPFDAPHGQLRSRSGSQARRSVERSASGRGGSPDGPRPQSASRGANGDTAPQAARLSPPKWTGSGVWYRPMSAVRTGRTAQPRQHVAKAPEATGTASESPRSASPKAPSQARVQQASRALHAHRRLEASVRDRLNVSWGSASRGSRSPAGASDREHVGFGAPLGTSMSSDVISGLESSAALFVPADAQEASAAEHMGTPAGVEDEHRQAAPAHGQEPVVHALSPSLPTYSLASRPGSSFLTTVGSHAPAGLGSPAPVPSRPVPSLSAFTSVAAIEDGEDALRAALARIKGSALPGLQVFR